MGPSKAPCRRHVSLEFRVSKNTCFPFIFLILASAHAENAMLSTFPASDWLDLWGAKCAGMLVKPRVIQKTPGFTSMPAHLRRPNRANGTKNRPIRGGGSMGAPRGTQSD